MSEVSTTETDAPTTNHQRESESVDPHGSMIKSRDPDSDFNLYTEDGLIVSTEDGLYGAVAESQDSVQHQKNRLWNLLTPLSYGDVEMRKNVEVYHTEREVYLKAERILVDDDGLPGFVFQVAPRDFSGESEELLRVWGDQFAEWVENETVKTKEQVNDELQEMMDDL